MWIFSKYGFYALANARMGNGEFDQPVDPDRIAIRARLRDHLLNLQDRFPSISQIPIHTDQNADYPHRIFVDKSVWVKIAADLAEEMDYDRFKPTAAPYRGYDEYHGKLLEVWRVMYEMERE